MWLCVGAFQAIPEDISLPCKVLEIRVAEGSHLCRTHWNWLYRLWGKMTIQFAEFMGTVRSKKFQTCLHIKSCNKVALVALEAKYWVCIINMEHERFVDKLYEWMMNAYQYGTWKICWQVICWTQIKMENERIVDKLYAAFSGKFSITFRHVPSHASREVLVVLGSLTTCDPGDMNDTIKVKNTTLPLTLRLPSLLELFIAILGTAFLEALLYFNIQSFCINFDSVLYYLHSHMNKDKYQWNES